MKRYGIALWFILFIGIYAASSQVAPDCGDAVPICNNTPVNGGTHGFGTDDFDGSDKTGCLEKTTTGAIESNSAWYRFRTGASGQLGFNIGFDASEDWDFALYKSSDCDNLGEPVRCNFFDNSENETFMGVGESPNGNAESVLYDEWLQVSPGEDYYLMINNFSNNNSGFSIQFSGNIFVTDPYDALDCSIISNLLGPPIAACEYENVFLDATTTDAVQYDWYMDTGTGFEPIIGEAAPTLQALVSAMYRVRVTTATNTVISDVQVVFSPSPNTYAVSNDVSCSDSGIYDLSQKDSEALGGQNPDEIIVSYYSSLSDAINGINSLPKQYPKNMGSETIYVRTASILNPNCFDAPQEFQLTALETPVLNFPLEVYLCEDNTFTTIGETAPNPNYTYVWDSGETAPSILVSQAGTYTVTVTNHQLGEICKKTRSIKVVISKTPQITDVVIDDLQDNNTVSIITDIEGNFEYQLDNGAFQSGNVFNDVAPGTHRVTINDINGCGSVTETIVVMGFFKYFTPNGDGINDLWHVNGIAELEEPVVFIYDRYGKFLKQLNQDSIGWDGTFNGTDLPSSDYWFKLTYLDVDGQRVFAKYVNNHFALRR